MLIVYFLQLLKKCVYLTPLIVNVDKLLLFKPQSIFSIPPNILYAILVHLVVMSHQSVLF